MNSPRELTICTILGLFAVAWTSPVVPINENSGNYPQSVVVPQVGVLEDRPDISVKTVKNDDPSNNGNNGILVPVVSLIDGTRDASKSVIPAENSLVALFPAPATMIDSAQSSIGQYSPIAALPIVPSSDGTKSADRPQSEILRSLRDVDSESEIMDVAEDIVFRPLFRIRPGNNGQYTPTGNLARRRYNRRYNVNGYYRLPYDYFRN